MPILSLPSVTTLISSGVAKPWLVAWAAKMTSEYALDNLDEIAALAKKDRAGTLRLLAGARFARNQSAKTRGSDIHAAIEQIALGLDPAISEGVAPYVEQYRRFLSEHKPEYLLAEAPVYNPEGNYAGTLDGVIMFPQPIKDAKAGPFVLDVKTTDKPKEFWRNGPPYSEVALQLTAYRRAQYVGLDASVKVENRSDRFYSFDPDTTRVEPMLATEGGVCLVVSPSEYALFPIRTDEPVWQAFLSVAESARWTLETSKQVIGRPISPPEQEDIAA